MVYITGQGEETIDEAFHEKLIYLINSEISNFPPRRRDILRLYYFNRLSTKEVAKKCQISVSAVMVNLKKGLSQLKSKLSDHHAFRDFVNIETPDPKNDHILTKEHSGRFCLRVRNGRIEIIIEKPDGTWILSDGMTQLPTGLYVFSNTKWSIALRELEKLINKPELKEKELQEFFETYPEMIFEDDCDCVIPQATIVKADGIEWRADFVLVPSDQLSFAKILELKLPSEKIENKRKSGHSNYSQKLYKAIKQLKDYHYAFDSHATREKFNEMYKTDIFKPGLQLVIGRRNSICNTRDFLELQYDHKVQIIDWDSFYEKSKRKFM
jgi:hypothetical protein